MTITQKIQLRLSECRQNLNELLQVETRSAEQQIEMETLTKEVSAKEPELRAALAAEPDKHETRMSGRDAADVVDAASYHLVTRDPAGAILEPAHGYAWPAPARGIGSFALTYSCGWVVTDDSNTVPASVQYMVERAVAFRAGGGGNAGFTIGSLKINVADAYRTDAIPREIASIGRAWAYRPGLFAARP